MLRKSMVIGVIALVFGLSSCGDGMPTSLCDCMEVQAEIVEKSMDLPIDDEEGFRKIKDQYTKEIEACDKLSDVFSEENKNTSIKEQKAKQTKLLEGCDAVLRLEELMQEQLDKKKNNEPES